MLTYVYVGTNDLARAIRFYSATLAPLGMPRCVTGDPEWDRTAAGWGIYEDGGARELGFWVGTPFDERTAAVARERRGYGRTTAPTSTQPTCAIPTATSWPRCRAASRRAEPRGLVAGYLAEATGASFGGGGSAPSTLNLR